jgi:dihydroorotate dehydrogenase
LLQVYEYTLSNPIGISAGLDKDAEIPSALFALGPAIVEVGGTTPLPQAGNPKIRVFRLPSQNALINRYGLNSKGADHMASLLRRRVRNFAYANGFGLGEFAEQRVLDGEAGVPPGSLTEGKLLAVQIAKNKSTSDKDIKAIKEDYVYCVDRLAKYADILVVNVSSPNTPGLRDLQQTGPLTAILKAVVDAANRVGRKSKPFVMAKVSPDEDSDEQIIGICDAVWASGVAGVIVANTTNRREPLPKGYVLPPWEQAVLRERGGFSGPHLFGRTLALVSRYRTLLDQGPLSKDLSNPATSPSADTSDSPSSREPNYIPKMIFASGGITDGQQVFQILKAGANLAMMFTGIAYGGIGTVTRIKEELRQEKERAAGEPSSPTGTSVR